MSDDIESKVDYCFRALDAICKHFNIPVLTEEEAQKLQEFKRREWRDLCVYHIVDDLLKFICSPHQDNFCRCKFKVTQDLHFSIHVIRSFYSKGEKQYERDKDAKDGVDGLITLHAGEYNLEIGLHNTQAGGYEPPPTVTITGDNGLTMVLDDLRVIGIGIFDEQITIDRFIPKGTISSPIPDLTPIC